MIRPHSRLALFCLLALAVAAVLPATADAQSKKKKKKVVPACGIAFLPMAEGSEWTYESFVPEGVEFPPGMRPEEPKTMTIKVVKVAKSGDKTTIELEESYRKVLVKTTLECTKEKLLVPPDSFFYAGQPGGGINVKLEKLERKGETFLVKKGLKENGYEELKVVALRQPGDKSGATLAPADLELERKMTIQGTQVVESGMGSHKAIRTDVQITGRATTEGQKDKPFNMPQFDAVMFFEPNTGVVRVENKMGQGWRIKDYKTAADAP